MTKDEAVGEIKFLRCMVRDLLDQSCDEEQGKHLSGLISTYADAMRYLNEWGMAKDFDDRGMRVVYTNMKEPYGGYPADAVPVTIK